MLNVKYTIPGDVGGELGKKLEEALSPSEMDRVTSVQAALIYADVVQATPKKWFGQVRAAWKLERGTSPGSYWIKNKPDKGPNIMAFLEYGTKAHGPVKAKALFIPLVRAAAAGYRKGMVFGRDFVLRKWVKGIEPRGIVKEQREKAQTRLLAAFKAHLESKVFGK